MAASQQGITVGSSGSVGSIMVDPARVTGEGGPVRPHLVVPITIKMYTRSREENQLAIPQLSCAISTTQHGHPQNDVCAPVTLSLHKNMAVVSLIYDHEGFSQTLRFPLTWPEITALESHRHGQPGQDLHLHLTVDPMVVGLQSSGEQPDNSPWGHRLGLSSFMSVFWNVQSISLPLSLTQETWVEKVLPGLGYDRLRMVEVALPPPLPEHGSAAIEFDRALRAWNQRRYDDCVAACRGLVKIWTLAYGAKASNPLGQVIGDQKHWAADDPRRVFLTSTWNGLITMVNETHHPENSPQVPLQFEAAEARLIFMMVTAFSEYLARAIG